MSETMPPDALPGFRPQAGEPALPSRSASAAGERFQFRLIHLFVLTTLVALSSAVAASWGLGKLPIVWGLTVAALNVRGAFRAMQTGRAQTALLFLAWMTFLTSLALPSITVFGPVAGWGAAWFALQVFFRAVTEGEILRHEVWWYLHIDFANALIGVLPLVIWRLRRGGGKLLAAALCIAAIGPFSVGWDTPMLVGYYVWCLSFMLALVALPITRQTLAAMFAVAAAIGVVALWM